MKSARVTLPEEPANGVTAGIDWSRDDHAVSVVDARGFGFSAAVNASAKNSAFTAGQPASVIVPGS